MLNKILITGSEGLIGRALCAAFSRIHTAVVHFDKQAPPGPARGDVCDMEQLHESVRGCAGIIHLAAVSRVVWGEKDPDRCWATNVEGTRNVLCAAAASPDRPFMILASSREVYGQPGHLPVSEETPCAPVNVYGRSKYAAENLVFEAQAAGHRAAVLRFSNVYGCPRDHRDRVVPAFARAAVAGLPLHVQGDDHLFDFTHLEDTARGIVAAAEILARGERRLPPIHLLTGIGTSLGALAAMAIEFAGTSSAIVKAPPRTYDVARFYGDPTNARSLLGWEAQVSVRQGLLRLIDDIRAEMGGNQRAVAS